ncbi:hypothetical protein BpHYR1_030303 [Brachionus plicatilis]|uniref:Uncharacterized protein n=1 Tax=Brachionus plicatilis TaxID=10195 RepID=A0A3M7SXA8_BRAPC|nr:hypothetical protein BpHYR1_030303 [Brachionus plicatilis]
MIYINFQLQVEFHVFKIKLNFLTQAYSINSRSTKTSDFDFYITEDCFSSSFKLKLISLIYFIDTFVHITGRSISSCSKNFSSKKLKYAEYV